MFYQIIDYIIYHTKLYFFFHFSLNYSVSLEKFQRIKNESKSKIRIKIH